MEKFTNFGTQVRCQKTSFGCCKRKLSRLYESFVSHDTKRCKLSKRIRSSLSGRESKDEFFLKRVLRSVKIFTRYCENRKRIIYSKIPDIYLIQSMKDIIQLKTFAQKSSSKQKRSD